MRRTPILLVTLLVVSVGLFKFWLTSTMQITAWGGAAHDDQLYVKLALSILQGNWLGDYDNLTLAKSPFYPLWLAFNHVLGISPMIAQQVLYIVVGMLLLIPLSKLMPAWILPLLFAVFVFNPVIETRLIREAIYPALGVLVLAGFTAMYVHARNSVWKLLSWAALAGTSLAGFWLTRAEGVWILPAILPILACTLFRIFHRPVTLPSMLWRLGACVLPFLLLGTAVLAVKALNENRYGVAAVVEFKDTAFPKAYGALTRIKQQKWHPMVPVPKTVREELYKASPAFRQLRPYLEGPANRWSDLTCLLYPDTCGELVGSWFTWALRDAVSMAGYYHDGATTDRYYSRLANEINAACESNLLECGPRRRIAFLPPFNRRLLAPVAASMWKGVRFLLKYVDYPPPLFAPRYSPTPYSLGTPETQRRFRLLAEDRLAPLALPDPGEGEIRNVVHQRLEPGVFPASWLDFLGEFQRRHRYVPAGLGKGEGSRKLRLRILRWIEQTYHGLHPLLALGGLACYAFCLWRCVRNRRFPGFLLLFNTSLLAAIAARLLILSVLDVSSFPAVEPWYLAPLYPLVGIFSMAAMAGLASMKK